MVLPELSWQFLYGRLAWAVVLAALVASAWPSAWRLSRRALGAIVGASSVLMALPGAASGAWHLALAFQYPSGLLLGLSVAGLLRRWRGTHRADGALLPVPAAAVLAVTGAVLYLDAFGLLTRGWYYAGFGPNGAPLVAVLAAIACAAAIVQDRQREQAAALLGAVTLFSLARLPSGNLWDAVLDPLLWAWAIATLLVAAVRRLLRAMRTHAPAEAPARTPEPALQAAGIDPYSPIKE
ncbi:hypothetical protein LQ564_22375 [Massilia sp. G4R7]|uniref:Uncharacterized protein n=1 Tax=Massilia phyllostachyos TaxID=2898585 RepID=A0ABS8QDC3_9BURK|nr:hypothetical protein [Massilia phyllostachyos]MCD2519052.1 hypothetical protein [Massilia phyllostachyos]